MRTQEQADIPAPQMSCYLCNVKESKVGQTAGGGGWRWWAGLRGRPRCQVEVGGERGRGEGGAEEDAMTTEAGAF